MTGEGGNLVSIIVPAYNAEKTLERCVKSVQAQTYGNLEIVVVDDGSSDSTEEVATALSNQDGRVIVVHQANSGLSGARNTGIERARGELLFFLDADDLIDPDEISSLVTVMTATDADLVIGGITDADEEGRSLSTVKIPPRVIDEEGFWESYESGTKSEDHTEYVVACGKLFRRKLFDVERFDVGKIHEDEFIIHRLVARSNIIAFADVVGYRYVKTDGSISRSPSSKSILDKAEGLLLRSAYFVNRRWWRFALTAASEARGALSNALELEPSVASSERFATLNRQWKSGIKEILRNASGNAAQKALCALFAISPKAYIVLKGGR